MDLVNAQGKPFTWSFSAMDQFIQCPRSYAAKRFYCTVKDEGSEATIWGSRVHKAIELRLRDGLTLPEEFAVYEPYCRSVEKMPGLLKVEHQVAFDRNMRLVSWFAPTAWGRSVFDIFVDGDEKVTLIDWKTGKVKDNPMQLKLFAAVASLLCPDAEEYVTKFVWLKYQQTSGAVYQRAEIPAIWGEFMQKVSQMEKAWEYENFPCNPSGLCRKSRDGRGPFCPVRDCIHWGGGR
jgi:hypothetical protein